MKKGVAVPYIIALIMGVAVIALLGYWFFVLGGRIPGQATTTWCQTKENTWCSGWAQTGSFPSQDWDDYAPGCSSIGIAKPSSARCRTLLGIATTTSPATTTTSHTTP